MKDFKMITFFIGTLVLAMLMVSPALAQSGEDKTKVQQHQSGVMMQVSQPSEFIADSAMIQVMESDSATGDVQKMLQSRKMKGMKQLGQMNNVQKKALSYDRRAMVRQRMQTAMPDYQEPPVGIRTEAGQGNRVVVYVKNRTEKPLTDLSVQPDWLPEEWSSQPADRSISVLPAGHQQTVTFSLQASTTQARNVGFKLQTKDGLSIGWTARVALPESAAGGQKPKTFEVHGNYPNPFNPTTTISYSLPQTMEVQLTIYNILGQKVVTLVNSEQEAGMQNVTWDASRVASGTYLYRMVAEAADGRRFITERKMVLIK